MKTTEDLNKEDNIGHILKILDSENAFKILLTWDMKKKSTDGELCIQCDYDSTEEIETEYGTYIAYFDEDDHILLTKYTFTEKKTVYLYIFIYTQKKVSISVLPKEPNSSTFTGSIHGYISGLDTQIELSKDTICAYSYTGINYAGVCTIENGNVNEFEWYP